MKGARHEYFPSTLRSTRTKEGTVLVLPGLLGEKTMVESVVFPLTHEGFNVMMVGHSRRNRRLHACNEDRMLDVYAAGEESVELSGGDTTVHFLVHSMGNFDAVNTMEYIQRKEDVPFSVFGYAAIAGVGRNNFTPMPWDVLREFYAHRGEVARNIYGERSVLRKSLGSAARNPLLAYFEAISAARANVDESVIALGEEGVFQVGYEVYGSIDRLVPKPRNRTVDTYEGHHMTPVYRPEVAIDAARFITNSQRMAA